MFDAAATFLDSPGARRLRTISFEPIDLPGVHMEQQRQTCMKPLPVGASSQAESPSGRSRPGPTVVRDEHVGDEAEIEGRVVVDAVRGRVVQHHLEAPRMVDFGLVSGFHDAMSLVPDPTQSCRQLHVERGDPALGWEPLGRN